MNVFDVVFRNALAKEVVFSSVFNFLLDKNETHGIFSWIACWTRFLTTI